MTESPSGESGSGRFTTNWLDAKTSCLTHVGGCAALGAAFSHRAWVAAAYLSRRRRATSPSRAGSGSAESTTVMDAPGATVPLKVPTWR